MQRNAAISAKKAETFLEAESFNWVIFDAVTQIIQFFWSFRTQYYYNLYA